MTSKAEKKSEERFCRSQPFIDYSRNEKICKEKIFFKHENGKNIWISILVLIIYILISLNIKLSSKINV